MRKIRRKPHKNEREKRIVAAVWYMDKYQWKSMREISVDPDRFEDSYDSWLEMFQGSMKELVGAGLFPIKTPIDVDDFREWCSSTSKPCDASSRSEYAASLLQKGRKTAVSSCESTEDEKT